MPDNTTYTMYAQRKIYPNILSAASRATGGRDQQQRGTTLPAHSRTDILHIGLSLRVYTINSSREIFLTVDRKVEKELPCCTD
jgi:hypothetical protein